MPLWNWGQPQDGIIQVAFITDDIRRDMERFTRELRIGPWFLFEHFAFDRLTYRGQDSTLDITLALGNSGAMQFELIEQHCASRSAYTETRDKRGFGFHHWAVAATPDSYDARLTECQARGFATVLDGSVKVGGRATYLDTLDTLGGMIEIIEVTPGVEQLFTMIAQANQGWDGAHPVRTLG